MLRYRSLPFSLTELMVVMVIMGIMLAMFLPMFDDVVSGNAPKGGVRALGFQISQAKQLAQSRRRPVALIMPSVLSSTTPANHNLTEENKYSMYRLAFLKSNNVEFDEWVDGSKWGFVPTGASIMEVDDDVGIVDEDASNVKQWAAFPEDNSPTTVTSVPFDSWLCVDEGPPETPAAANVTASSRAVVFKVNGTLAADAHCYVTVGEAKFFNAVPGNWVLKAKGEAGSGKYLSCANQITIRINSFTGGVKYATPDRYDDSPAEDL